MKHVHEIYPNFPMQNVLAAHTDEIQNIKDAIECITLCSNGNLSKAVLLLVKLGMWLGQTGRAEVKSS